MNNLEMTASAVKIGQERSKDGRKFRMDTATFILPDGESFRLTFNAFAVPLKAGDIAVFGVRSGVNERGYEYSSLTIASARPSGK